MTSPHRRPPPPPPRRLLAIAALSFASLTVGCWRPLAHQHEYFSPLSGSAARIDSQTRHTVSHYRALQAASHACPPRSPAAAAPPSPPPAGVKAAAAAAHGTSPANPEGGPARLPTPAPDATAAAAARDALAGLCAASPARPDVAAHGGASNAYGRWVRDEVRKLPATSRTAASAAGGS